jgi:hypothetical protein
LLCTHIVPGWRGPPPTHAVLLPFGGNDPGFIAIHRDLLRAFDRLRSCGTAGTAKGQPQRAPPAPPWQQSFFSGQDSKPKKLPDRRCHRHPSAGIHLFSIFPPFVGFAGGPAFSYRCPALCAPPPRVRSTARYLGNPHDGVGVPLAQWRCRAPAPKPSAQGGHRRSGPGLMPLPEQTLRRPG